MSVFSFSATISWPQNSLPLFAVIVRTWLRYFHNIPTIAFATSAALFAGTFRIRYNLLFRSTRLTIAPVPCLPKTVSASQSPNRFFLFTIAGRLSMPTRLGIITFRATAFTVLTPTVTQLFIKFATC